MQNIEQRLFHWKEGVHDPGVRCSAQGKNGQCPFLAILDEDGNKKANTCSRHAGDSAVKHAENKEANMYRLQRWDQRLTEFGKNPKVKGLRDEIGVLRIVLEEVMNKCQSSTDLLINSNKIAEIACKIEKLVVSCDKLEKSSGALMDKAAALTFAGKIVDIIANNLASLESQVSQDIISSLIDSINEEIIGALGTLK